MNKFSDNFVLNKISPIQTNNGNAVSVHEEDVPHIVVAQAGVVFNGDDEFEASDEVTQKTIDPEELESLSAFSDFIDSLDLGVLGKITLMIFK